MRHICRGAAALIPVVGVAVLAAVALTVHYAGEEAARKRALDRQAGHVFAAWFVAAHRATQERDLGALIAGDASAILTPERLRQWGAVPPGLPDRAGRMSTLTLGIASDGNNVPMAFAVLEPGPGQMPEAIRAGAVEAGVADIAMSGDVPTPMAVHLPVLEGALGRRLDPDALYVTADFGVWYREDHLYRRSQPGRPWLNRMDTALDTGSRRILHADTVAAETMEVAGNSEIGGQAVTDGDGHARSLRASALTAERFDTGPLAISAELRVGRAVTTVLSGRSVRVEDHLETGSLVARDAIATETLTAGQGIDVTGSATVSALDSRTANAGSALQTGNVAAEGTFAPNANFGTMETGTCNGC